MFVVPMSVQYGILWMVESFSRYGW